VGPRYERTVGTTKDPTHVGPNAASIDGLRCDVVGWRAPAAAVGPLLRGDPTYGNRASRGGHAFRSSVRHNSTTYHRARHGLGAVQAHDAAPLHPQSRRSAAGGASLLVLPRLCGTAARRARARRLPDVHPLPRARARPTESPLNHAKQGGLTTVRFPPRPPKIMGWSSHLTTPRVEERALDPRNAKGTLTALDDP